MIWDKTKGVWAAAIVKEDLPYKPLNKKGADKGQSWGLREDRSLKDNTTSRRVACKTLARDLKELIGAQQFLPDTCAETQRKCLYLLNELDKCNITMKVLERTRVGKSVARLKKYPALRPIASRLLKKLKKVYRDGVEAHQLSLLEEWRTAVEALDVDSVLESVQKNAIAIEKHTSMFSESFIRKHDVEMLVQKTGTLIAREGIGYDRTHYFRALHKRMTLEMDERVSFV